MPRKVITIPAGNAESAAVRVDDVVAASFFVDDYDGSWVGSEVSIYVCDTADGEYLQLIDDEASAYVFSTRAQA